MLIYENKGRWSVLECTSENISMEDIEAELWRYSIRQFTNYITGNYPKNYPLSTLIKINAEEHNKLNHGKHNQR